MEISFSDGDTFRFRRSDRVTDAGWIYIALRRESLWHITLEGNTSPWLYWVFSDETVLKDCWIGRLTD
jgi:hypothetical protein